MGTCVWLEGEEACGAGEGDAAGVRIESDDTKLSKVSAVGAGTGSHSDTCSSDFTGVAAVSDMTVSVVTSMDVS